MSMKGEFWRIIAMNLEYDENVSFRRSDEGFAMRFKSGFRLECVIDILKALGVKNHWFGEIWVVHKDDTNEDDGEIEIYISVEDLSEGEKDTTKV